MSERKLLEEFSWEVTERPFQSPTPVVGGLIVRFREFWMSLAARWYIRPLIAQQNQFNRELLLHLQKVEAHFDDNETNRFTP